MDEAVYTQFREDLFAAIWRDLDPFEDEIEDTEKIPLDRVFPLLRQMGAFGLIIPERYGGSGLTVAQYLPIIAEFAKIQGGIRALVHVHNSMAHALAEMGTEVQAAAVLPAAAQGLKSVAFALTEPDHGTGADIGTLATRSDGEYVITGRKWLITNSDFASHFIVFCKVEDRGEARPSAILVESDRPGLTIESLPELMGCKGGAHGQLTFDEVRVPVDSLLGEEGDGVRSMQDALEISRVFVAASSLGTAEYALDLSVRYARRRSTFGKPIAERQAVQRYLAEMGTEVHALRLMLADVAAKADAGEPISAEASMCKLAGLETVGRVTDRALLVHGGIGYTRKHRIERLYRDARLNWLEEGTPTIQQLIIARELIESVSSEPVPA
jgi:alkylation response protein AidB-like acyl-CoA dehydrogenase